MTQLSKFRDVLGDQEVSDGVLQFYLDLAQDIICERRDTVEVEQQYLNLQIQIAVDLFNRRGAEGEVAHSELGIARTWSDADVSASLLAKIVTFVKTPFSNTRIV